jgi:hypothetical protein
LDRALEDLGARVESVLYFSASRLEQSHDPVGLLATWVAELLTEIDGRPRRREEAWDGDAWWERLLTDLDSHQFVIVVDDAQVLSGPQNQATRVAVGRALRRLSERRTRSRVAVVGTEIPGEFIDMTGERVALVTLMPFTWDELWRWIRRNLPVLTRWGKVGLAPCYTRLGNHLEKWQDLANRVARGRAGVNVHDIAVALTQVAAPERAPRRWSLDAALPRLQRPLRVACAGGIVADADRFADALTRFAAQHSVGGRMLAAEGDLSSGLAVLLPIESPFVSDGCAVEGGIVRWLDAVIKHHADIVLLDCGAMRPDSVEHELIRRAAQHALLIAAAGNEGLSRVRYPAAYPEVLAVGSLSEPGALAPYTSYDPRVGKPELFALDRVQENALSRALSREADDAVGTSVAAFVVTAVSALVWAMDPSREARWVRNILVGSGTRFRTPSSRRDWGVSLDIERSLTVAREATILSALAHGPLTLPELLASVGFPVSVTIAMLDDLEASGKVLRSEDRNREVYGLADG